MIFSTHSEERIIITFWWDWGTYPGAIRLFVVLETHTEATLSRWVFR